MDSDWKKLPIPLGLTVTFIAAVFGGYAYLHSEFVMAEDFKQYQQSQAKEMRDFQREQTIRGLERDRRKLEADLIMLDVKKETAKGQYTPVDKALHEKVKTDLADVKTEIKELRAEASRDRGAAAAAASGGISTAGRNVR